MITFLSDASEVGSCAHQLMVSVRFYWIVFFCHDGHFPQLFFDVRSSRYTSAEDIGKVPATGFQCVFNNIYFFYLNDVLFLNISSSVAFLGSYT